jgi:excisionase family DNA binding protein
MQRLTITRQTPFEALPELLSVEEFRAYVGVSRSLAYELIRCGALPAVRFGRLVRVPKAGLQRYLAQNGNAATGASEAALGKCKS